MRLHATVRAEPGFGGYLALDRPAVGGPVACEVDTGVTARKPYLPISMPAADESGIIRMLAASR